MAGFAQQSNSWQTKSVLAILFLVLGVCLGVGESQGIYPGNEETFGEPLNYGEYDVERNQLVQPDDESLSKFFDVEVSKKDGVEGKEYFPLLMPKVHPESKEAYLCTPIEIKDEEYYITGKEVII